MHITLGATIFADNTSGRPFLIIPAKNLPPTLAGDVLDWTAVAGQEAGWITAELFREWVAKMFIPEIQRRRRILGRPTARALLLCDGHASRGDVKALELLRENYIDLSTPVSHSSHLCQALDLSFFLHFKSQLSGLKWTVANTSSPEYRLTICRAACKAYYGASFPEYIKRSWEFSGIWPFNPEVPLGHKALVKDPSAVAEVAAEAKKRKRKREEAN